MSIPTEDKGIVPRVIIALFNHMKEASSESMDFTIRCSFLEIYNEGRLSVSSESPIAVAEREAELRDLLDTSNRSKSITIRETPTGQVVPYGIEEREVSSAEELLK